VTYAMTSLRHKRPRLRLDSTSYRVICKKVFARDGWRCQNCGSSSNLQIHHIIRRSSLGHDSEQNLITLCKNCHEKIHRKDSNLTELA
jgi:5-methylcytosine-specific restriction endonuclease McrA